MEIPFKSEGNHPKKFWKIKSSKAKEQEKYD